MLIAVGSCSKPSTTVSSGVSLPCGDQAGDLADRLRRAPEVVEDDEALHRRALDEQIAERARSRRGVGRVVAGDQAAERDAGADVEPREDRVHEVAADILEVDVDAVGRRRGELGGPVVGAVVDGRVEAKLVGEQRALLGSAGDPDDACAVGLGELAGDRADRARRGRDDDRLARLWLADVADPDPRGEPGHPERAQVGARRDALGDVDRHEKRIASEATAYSCQPRRPCTVCPTA